LKPGCPASVSVAITAACTPGETWGYEYVWKPAMNASEKCGGSMSDATCSSLSTCSCGNDETWECDVMTVSPCSNWALDGTSGPAWAFTPAHTLNLVKVR
jgi:hypothetical protein